MADLGAQVAILRAERDIKATEIDRLVVDLEHIEAERDAARAEVARKDEVIWACRADQAELQAQRDAARVEVARLREALVGRANEMRGATVEGDSLAYYAYRLHALAAGEDDRG
jgi:chromosome segregation ATPase